VYVHNTLNADDTVISCYTFV